MKIRGVVKAILRGIPGRFALPLFYAYHRYCVKAGQLSGDLDAVLRAVTNNRRAIDIGANIGVYAYSFSKAFSQVEAFEPNRSCTEMLRDYAERRGRVAIHNVGLSSRNGQTNLYVPIGRDGKTQHTGLASLIDPGGNRAPISIPLRRLDDYAFSPVDLIKIDVEGHEWEVLEGALETIRREKPILLVEIEQRHLKQRKIEEVFAFICSLGYQGEFLRQRRRLPISEFSVERDQLPYLDNVFSKKYVNNFLFMPR